MPSAQVLHPHAGIGLTQEADDLFLGKTLLHVQSPWVAGLDSKSPCYSKPGGRRQINAKFGRGTVGVGSAGWRVGGARPGEHSNASIKSQWRPSLRSLSPCYKTKWRSLIQVRHKDRRNSDHQTLDTTKRMVVENGKQQHRIRQVQTALRLRKRSKNRSA
ncbi:DUF4113 domain-containing protein [Stenotrophomonas maltophilia]|uniref:DUF4113 domain-containing protein n=1 Tax=Stenotrophomonas TaxID=40323 RepID=UPI0038C7EC75